MGNTSHADGKGISGQYRLVLRNILDSADEGYPRNPPPLAGTMVM